MYATAKKLYLLETEPNIQWKTIENYLVPYCYRPFLLQNGRQNR